MNKNQPSPKARPTMSKNAPKLKTLKRRPADLAATLEKAAYAIAIEVETLYTKVVVKDTLTGLQNTLTWEESQKLIHYLKLLAQVKQVVQDAIEEMTGFDDIAGMDDEKLKALAEKMFAAKDSHLEDDSPDEDLASPVLPPIGED